MATAQPGGASERRRGRRVAVGLSLALLLAGGMVAWYALAFRSHGSSGSGNTTGGAPPPATQPVTRQDLSQTTPANATLGYANSYTVTGRGTGTLTSLPSAGTVIRQGKVLYRVNNGSPVVLLHGTVPMWRAMHEGMHGSDVTQLNEDLVNLGYSNYFDISSLGWDYYSWDTKYGVQQLEEDLGVTNPPGTLALGSVVFEPEALRVATVTGTLGGPATGPILTATSTRHVVTISLNVTQEGDVKVGDEVTVTLPNGASTPGRISSVGAVASGTGASATIPVTVTLTHPDVAGSLDEAPVTVEITNASVHNALAVPVGALLAQPSGSYAVEVVGPGGARHLVPVTVGIFDDNAGMVQISGPGVVAGMRVVVPST